MFDENEREIAGKIVNNKEMMGVLKKIFVPDRPLIREELEKNIASLSDAEYGQCMKALVLAEAHVENSFSNLKQIAKHKTATKSPIAPK